MLAVVPKFQSAIRTNWMLMIEEKCVDETEIQKRESEMNPHMFCV